MKVEDCYQLGEVIKTHGLKGEVSITLDVDFPTEYKELESVFLQQSGNLVPFFIESLQINGNKALTKFEDIDTIESAAELVKSAIFLPLSLLPELPEGGYYYHDLVGCKAFEEDLFLGTVKEVIDLSGNQLLLVQKKEQEILIPMKDGILKMVDVTAKRIDVKLPDGLLDLYS